MAATQLSVNGLNSADPAHPWCRHASCVLFGFFSQSNNGKMRKDNLHPAIPNKRQLADALHFDETSSAAGAILDYMYVR
jgi:hypothetical protein